MPLTDLFVASMDELRAACRGWKEPLPRPVARATVNPFTKKAVETLTTAPDPSESFDTGASKHVDLTRLRRVDLKGLGTLEMERLIGVVLEEPEQQTANVYDTPLHPPPGSEELIFRVPTALVERLARMDSTALAEGLRQWNAAAGRNMSDCMAPLTELARKAVAESRQLFMWMSP